MESGDGDWKRGIGELFAVTQGQSVIRVAHISGHWFAAPCCNRTAPTIELYNSPT